MLLTRLRYAREVTLALIKPTVASSPNLTRDIISRINDQGFNIINAKKVQFNDSMAEAFYGDHKGKFFYPRLYNYVRSGPVIALALEGDDVIARWRALIGPTKVSKVKFENPDCFRHDYGVTDTRNAFHGSDSMDNAFDELSIVFGSTISSKRTIESVEVPEFKVNGIVQRKNGEINLLSKQTEAVSEEKTREIAVNSNEMSLTKLARLSFWENFHQTGKNDWFLTHTQVFDVLKEEKGLANHLSYSKEDSLVSPERLAIVDIGCGTSAVGSVLAVKLKYSDISLVDFSEAACLYQKNRIDQISKHYVDKGLGANLFEDNMNTLEINRQNVKSLNYSSNTFDVMLDKGTMDAVSRLPDDEVFQSMDEMARVLKPGGKIIQFTEEPPEVRTELWETWQRKSSSDKASNMSVGCEEVGDHFIYRISM